MERLSNLNQQFVVNETSGKAKLTEKHPDDVVIVAAYRTALRKSGKGLFKDADSTDLLAGLLEGLVKKTGVNPEHLGDIAIGNVCNNGAGALEHRGAALAAGIPYTVPFVAINRQCSSGLTAVNDIANKIIAGQIDAGIGGGVESMSKNYGRAPTGVTATLTESAAALPGLTPMGITSENVAEKYGIGRQAQDEFAAKSFNKAEKAQAEHLFDEEIIPITVSIYDEEDNEKKITVSEDEPVRKGVTAASLSKIRPAFKADGSSHAGNSSQVTDGAAAVILMRRSFAQKHGYPVIAKWIGATVVGVPPEIMGIGPAVAIPALLKQLDLAVDDVDIYEINEAFASQAIYSIDTVKIPYEKVNPKGGAIAIGHPLGCTGARQIATLLPELKRTGGKIGLTSMCLGTGMGMASVIVSEQ